MAIDPVMPRSRRALLAGGLGAAVAAVAASLGRPALVDAGSDGDVVLGGVNAASSVTRITNTSNSLVDAIEGISTNGTGVVGQSGDVDGTGVLGVGLYAGVRGTSDPGTGVVGLSTAGMGVYGATNGTSLAGVSGNGYGENGIGVRGDGYGGNGPTTGVLGQTDSAAGTGVLGRVVASYGATTGVQGEAVSPTGTGVRGVSTSGTALAGTAKSSSGHALKTSGRLYFAKVSGVATISAGKTASALIYPGVDITNSSYVLLTPQRDPGSRRFWAVLSSSGNNLTIRTNVTRTYSIKIAWLLIG